MSLIKYILFSLMTAVTVYPQDQLDKTLKRLNKGSVAYLSVSDLATGPSPVLLDTREKEEYTVSHLQDAFWVGYREFHIDTVLQQVPDKNTAMVVYCSVGVRSENIGEKLKKAGYTQVKNLYGGIFEWKNRGYPVFNREGRETDSVHAFDKRWGKLLKKGIKVYDVAGSGERQKAG